MSQLRRKTGSIQTTNKPGRYLYISVSGTVNRVNQYDYIYFVKPETYPVRIYLNNSTGSGDKKKFIIKRLLRHATQK